MSKTIYLATTFKCSACKCQEVLLNTALIEHTDVKLEVCNYTDLPKWLRTSIKLTDFPVTILTKNGVVKYHFVGTKSVKKFNQLLEDINY